MNDEERSYQPRVTVGSRVPCTLCSGSGVSFRLELRVPDGNISYPVLCPACMGERQQTVRPNPEEAAG
jgi:DnaJ-class molecular chaperone